MKRETGPKVLYSNRKNASPPLAGIKRVTIGCHNLLIYLKRSKKCKDLPEFEPGAPDPKSAMLAPRPKFHENC